MQYTGIQCRSVDEATREIFTFFERGSAKPEAHFLKDPAITTYDLHLIRMAVAGLVDKDYPASISDLDKALDILSNPCPPSVFNEKKGDRSAELIMDGLAALPALRARSAITHALFGDGIHPADDAEQELSSEEVQSYLDFVTSLAKTKKINLDIKPGVPGISAPKELVGAAVEQKARSVGENLPTLWHLDLDLFRAKVEVCPPVADWAVNINRRGSLPTTTKLSVYAIMDKGRALRRIPSYVADGDELANVFHERMYHQATAGQLVVAYSLMATAEEETRGSEAAVWRGVIPFVVDQLYEMTAGVLLGKNAYAPDQERIAPAYEYLYELASQSGNLNPELVEPQAFREQLDKVKSDLVAAFATGLTGVISELPKRMINEHQAAGNKLTKDVLDEIRAITDKISRQVMAPANTFKQTGHDDKIINSLRDYAEGVIEIDTLVEEITESVQEVARTYDDEHDLPDEFEPWCAAFVKSICDDVELEVSAKLAPTQTP